MQHDQLMWAGVLSDLKLAQPVAALLALYWLGKMRSGVFRRGLCWFVGLMLASWVVNLFSPLLIGWIISRFPLTANILAGGPLSSVVEDLPTSLLQDAAFIVLAVTCYRYLRLTGRETGTEQ